MSGGGHGPSGKPANNYRAAEGPNASDDDASGPSEAMGLVASPLMEGSKGLVLGAIQLRDLLSLAVKHPRERRRSAVTKVCGDLDDDVLLIDTAKFAL